MNVNFSLENLLRSAFRSPFHSQFYFAVQCEYDCEKRERFPRMREVEARFSDATVKTGSDSSTAKDLNFTGSLRYL